MVRLYVNFSSEEGRTVPDWIGEVLTLFIAILC
jgi:hypothetical protein